MLHGNLILQFCRRITFFLPHMGAKRIEIDVEVKAIFLKKNPLGYDEDSDNGGILVPQTLQFQCGIWVFKKTFLSIANNLNSGTSPETLEQQSPCMDTGPETKLVSKRVTQN